jgi:hypothetical protein
MTYTFNPRFAFSSLITAFVLHNIEEAISICRYPVQSPVSFIQPATCNQFLFAVSLLTLAGISVYIAAMLTKNTAFYLFISTALAAVIFFNAFIPHLVVAIYTLSYTPGLFSAVLLNIPFSIIVLIKNKQSYINRKQMLIHVIGGFVAGYALFALTMGLAKFFM